MPILPADKQPILESLDTVTAEAVEWLWWPYIAVGKIAILDGEPGVGKSLFAVTLAAILSKGYLLPDQQGALTLPSSDPSVTLLLSAEDSLASTIRPRLDAAKADCSRVKAFTTFKDANDAEGEEQFFTLEHLPALENALKQCTPRLVILDPIQAYLGGKIDINMASQTRPLLAKLARLAEAHHCAILLIRHPAKSGQGRAIHRGLGSIDFIGAARTGLFIEQHPLDANKALLCQTKNNLGPLGRTQIFSKEEGVFDWKSASRITAEDLAGSGRGPDPVAYLKALCWLEERLKGNLAWEAEDILLEGENYEHSRKILYKAKSTLGVVSTQRKKPSEDDTTPDTKRAKPSNEWTWRLPPLSVIYPPTTRLTKERGIKEDRGSTGVSGLTGDTGLTGLTGVSSLVTGEEPTPHPDTPDKTDFPNNPDYPVSQVVPDTTRIPPHPTEDSSSVLEEFDEGIV